MTISIDDLPTVTQLAAAYNAARPARRGLKNVDPATVTVTVQVRGVDFGGAWQVTDATLRRTLCEWAFDQAKKQTRSLKQDLTARGLDVTGDEE